jgi:hypothetical protein
VLVVLMLLKRNAALVLGLGLFSFKAVVARLVQPQLFRHKVGQVVVVEAVHLVLQLLLPALVLRL